MREFRTSGSVGGRRGDPPVYPTPKDVTIGFTVAGIIAAFVPTHFFQTLFVGAGGDEVGFGAILAQAVVGPVAAFFTFIGSMGNIPLAAVLFSHGVSFAGVMAFIFSDLVVLPVLRIQASYYGWKMALYITAVFLVALVGSAVLLHYGFDFVGMLPDGSAVQKVTERDFFAVDSTLFLNVAFAALSLGALGWSVATRGATGGDATLGERVLQGLSVASLLWLGVGLGLDLGGYG